MARFLGTRHVFVVVAAGLGAVAGVYACGSDAELPAAPVEEDGGVIRRDGGPVDPIDGPDPAADSGLPPVVVACAKYCELVQNNCTGDEAQFDSTESCLAFCKHLPEGKPGEESSASVACRQYYAGTPARTDPAKYCLAAGPFGGGLCGDRCETFCTVTMSACSTDAGAPPAYAKHPECATACARFVFRDAGTDGGGESPDGPSAGDTLNCRQFHLRKAVVDPAACRHLGVDSGACR